MPGELDDVLAGIAEGLASSHTSIQHGEKRVQYRSPAEMREAIRLARELEDGPGEATVLNPRRPKL